jgi:hypothetical protein
MKTAKLIIDDRKVLSFIQLVFGISMVLVSMLQLFFELPTTAKVGLPILFLLQGIIFIFLGSNFRKKIIEREGDVLKIRWSHAFGKKAFLDNWIKEISIGTSYLFIKPLEGDGNKYKIDTLKTKSRESLIDFLRTHFPNRLKIR